MKNIQVIDGALNCSYSIFAATNDEFRVLFPNGTDVAFSDEVFIRLGNRKATKMLKRIWTRAIPKAEAHGIHGTIFYGLPYKKEIYPTRKEAEMAPYRVIAKMGRY